MWPIVKLSEIFYIFNCFPDEKKKKPEENETKVLVCPIQMQLHTHLYVGIHKCFSTYTYSYISTYITHVHTYTQNVSHPQLSSMRPRNPRTREWAGKIHSWEPRVGLCLLRCFGSQRHSIGSTCISRDKGKALTFSYLHWLFVYIATCPVHQNHRPEVWAVAAETPA